MLSGKSLTYIRNKRGLRTEPCGTPDFINSQEEVMMNCFDELFLWYG